MSRLETKIEYLLDGLPVGLSSDDLDQVALRANQDNRLLDVRSALNHSAQGEHAHRFNKYVAWIDENDRPMTWAHKDGIHIWAHNPIH